MTLVKQNIELEHTRKDPHKNEKRLREFESDRDVTALPDTADGTVYYDRAHAGSEAEARKRAAGGARLARFNPAMSS